MKPEHAPSRGFFGYGCDALAGVVSALILAFALKHPATVLVLLAYLSALPLFVVGFSSGVLSALIAAVCGVAAIFATGPVDIGSFYFFAYALPAVGLIFLSLRARPLPDGTIKWPSAGDMLVALAVFPCLIFLIVYAQMMGHDGGLLAATTEAFKGLSGHIGDMLATSGQKTTPQELVKIQDYVAFLARIAPAMAMGAWLLSTALVMSAAHAFVERQTWGLRPPFALPQVRLPRWFVLLALIFAAGSFAPAPYAYVALNLAIIFGIPLFFVGLAVAFDMAAHTRAPTLVLVVFYVALIVFPHLTLGVVMLGVVDHWVDFRKRFAEKAVYVKQGEKK
ncbi:MAG: DUF2232 domain-containing protein [Alphaproteobacteria bacterium]|nr:DUF2232 domain-containing protein [Alphaproteobacteria bacterium]